MVEADRGARRASDRRKLARLNKGGRHRHPLFWYAIGELIGPRGPLGSRGKAAFASVFTNAHWPQQRLLAAKERHRGNRLLCGTGNGAPFQRLFECPAQEAARRDCCPGRLRRRAQRARQLGVAAAEDFARC
eukprot:9472596-Pyramimonas_sp.AAC.1